MNWQDKGYLLKISRYNENSSIAEFFTEKHGKATGIIFGSTSKKIKNYLLIGNRFHINYFTKNENSIGNLKIEIDKITTPFILDIKLNFFCIVYSLNLISILSVENQKNTEVYNLLKNLFEIVKPNFDFHYYILWELDLLKNFGYELNFIDYTKLIKKNNSRLYVSKIDQNKTIPSFLINKISKDIDNKDIIKAFDLTGDFLSKSIFNENNLSIPTSRNEIAKILNNL